MCIVFDVDYWLRNPLNNSTPKKCLFGATYIVKNNDKCKYVHSDYGKAFEGAESWIFSNGFIKNIKNFGADNSLSSHTDNCKNNFLLLGEGTTDDINDSVGAAEKKFTINFNKAKNKVLLKFPL